MQVCRGQALQLITDLPVAFHCNKGGYSCRQDGEKPVLAAAIALLGEVGKMNRLDSEDSLLPKTPKLSTRSIQRSSVLQYAPVFFYARHSVCTKRSQYRQKSVFQFEITGYCTFSCVSLDKHDMQSSVLFMETNSFTQWKVKRKLVGLCARANGEFDQIFLFESAFCRALQNVGNEMF